MRRILIHCVAAIALAGASMGAMAQAWSPQKSVEIVVGSAPGGSNDSTARTMERILTAQKLVSVPISIMNRSGGGGTIASTYVTQHPGDAHILYVANSILSSNNIVGTTPIGPADFTQIAMLYEDHAVFAVRTESPLKTGKDLADRLKSDPRSLSFAIGNAFGSSRHMAAALLMKTLGGNPRDLKTVAFKGSAGGITAMLGGHIDVVVAGAVNANAHVAAGRMRVIAVAAPQRLSGTLAAAPTWREQGIDVVYGNWRGIFAPKGLSAAQVEYWESTLRRMAQAPEWKENLEKNHWTENFLTGPQLAKEIEQEYSYLKSMLTDLGLVKQ